MVESGEKWSKVVLRDQFGGIERDVKGERVHVLGHSRAKARREGSLDPACPVP